MSLVLDEAPRMLFCNARDMVAASYPLRRLRASRDAGDPLSYSPTVWSRLAELGFTALPFQECDGGLGLGLTEVVLLTEALGTGLAPEPYVGSIMLAGRLLAQSKGSSERSRLLRELMAGATRGALAYHERGTRYSLVPVCTHAERTPHGYTLDGQKTQVLGGTGADWFVVSALLAKDAGVGMFLVPASASGLQVTPQSRLDAGNACVLTLDGVQVPEDHLLFPAGAGLTVLEQVVDSACLALCGEMLGAMRCALDMTLEYLRSRKQFGVAIGTFQALRHRVARVFIEQELSRSAVMVAARALDANKPEAAALVSVAKARCSDAYVLTTNEAVQLHGGIGMTDEHDIGLFLKHARVCEMTFGDAAHHRSRFAQLSRF